LSLELIFGKLIARNKHPDLNIIYMKNRLLLFLLLVSGVANAQRWNRELGLNYVYSNPIGGMGVIIDRAHGGTMNFGFVSPDNRFGLGADLSLAIYGRDKSRQEYTFDDGTVAPMDVIVSNTFGTFTAYARFYAKTDGFVRPFFTARAGLTWFNTSLNIYDVDDADHCEPVEHDVLYDDRAFVAGAGVGARLDFSSIFKSMEAGRFFFETSFNLTHGGQVRYMNTNGPAPGNNAPQGDHVMTQFLNTETQVVHEHHVGYLYRSRMQMTELRFGAAMHIGR
jgi:hypothetical protein